MKEYQKNWLLIVGLFFLVIGLAIIFYLQEPVQKNFESNFISFLFFGVIIAPFLEEISFRGFLVFKKYKFWFSLILLTGYSLLNFNAISLVLLVAFLTLLVLKEKGVKFKSSLLDIQIIVATLLFATIHYKWVNFVSGDFIYAVFFQLSVGFLLSWVTLNYGIIKSMVAHGLYNLVVLGVTVLIAYNTLDFKKKVIETPLYKVSYQRSMNLLPSEGSFVPGEYSFEVHHLEPTKIHKLILMNFPIDQVIENKNIYNQEPFMSYNIEFMLKDTALSLEEEFIQFCIKEKLIVENENVLKLKQAD